jgi:hypothetical protein
MKKFPERFKYKNGGRWREGYRAKMTNKPLSLTASPAADTRSLFNNTLPLPELGI